MSFLIPPALAQLDPIKLEAFKKGGKAQIAFAKRMNDAISILNSCLAATGKEAALFVFEDG